MPLPTKIHWIWPRLRRTRTRRRFVLFSFNPLGASTVGLAQKWIASLRRFVPYAHDRPISESSLLAVPLHGMDELAAV